MEHESPSTPESEGASAEAQTAEERAAAPPDATERARPAAICAAPAPSRKADKKLRKRLKKAARREKDAFRALSSWERYRALRDALDDANDLVDLADHKARFALIIMGALNAVVFLIATRTDVVTSLPETLRPFLAIYAAAYAMIAVYFIIQAIESLRPRRAHPAVRLADQGIQDYPMGLRFFGDILLRDVEAYRTAWREVRLGQLNAELSVQVYGLARINDAKYAALTKLYGWLKTMTVMCAIFLAVVAYNGIHPKNKKHATKEATTAAVFAAPQRIANPGVSEPSGVAYHASLKRLFVIGDEGRIAELDEDGKLVRADRVGGNLEDVTVYTPTGQLLLLSEKKSEIILFDPKAHSEVRRWRLDRAGLLGREPTDKNSGFEGLFFREETGRPSGGVFYLTHQRTPAVLLELAFDIATPAAALPKGTLLHRWALDAKDLTAVTYVPALGRLLVLSDSKDALMVVTLDGTVEATVSVPGVQQEGLCIDGRGDLWIADDQAKVLWRIPGALAALDAHLRTLRGPSPGSAASPSVEPSRREIREIWP
jgi:uncharacterized protein YjiK